MEHTTFRVPNANETRPPKVMSFEEYHSAHPVPRIKMRHDPNGLLASSMLEYAAYLQRKIEFYFGASWMDAAQHEQQRILAAAWDILS